MKKDYQALLYYGIEDSAADCTVYHAFSAVDPALPHDDDAISAELAEQLDCEPDGDNFQCRNMYVSLPETLIQRIQQEAIQTYLANGAEAFIKENPAFADQVYDCVLLSRRCDDINGQLIQRPNAPALADEDIAKIANNFERNLSQNDAYYDAYWETADQTIDEFLKGNVAADAFGGTPASDAITLFHISTVDNIRGIVLFGLEPRLGERAKENGKTSHGIWFFSSREFLTKKKDAFLDEFPADSTMVVVRADIPKHLAYSLAPQEQECGLVAEYVCTTLVPPEYLSFYTIDGYSMKPVARIDFLGSNGRVSESIDYFSEKSFRKDLEKELNYGVPLSVILYRNKYGNTISCNYMDNLSCLPKSINIEDEPEEYTV